jgi:hypothetical protein
MTGLLGFSVRCWTSLLILLAVALPASAHKPSDSYLRLETQAKSQAGAPDVRGEWDIALRDLDYAIGLDADNDGQLTWDEVKARHDAIAAYALARLHLERGGAPCTLQAGAQLVDRHTDGAYTVLAFGARCPRTGALALDYRLFADVDPQHKGLVSVREGAGSNATVRTLVLGSDNPRAQLDDGAAQGFLSYVRHGMFHIWIGYDHILFLLSLLLPAVLVLDGAGWRAQWRAVDGPRAALADVLKIVTAFTLAHSITLSLAALGLVSLPSRWVESAIALSVLLAALNNVLPVARGRRWAAAFLFGLIHGFGFASVLADLGLQPGALAASLVGFNVGVEIGQLAIVAVFLPLAYLLRSTWFYRRVVLVGGSGLIMLVAALWMSERLFDLKLLPV